MLRAVPFVGHKAALAVHTRQQNSLHAFVGQVRHLDRAGTTTALHKDHNASLAAWARFATAARLHLRVGINIFAAPIGFIAFDDFAFTTKRGLASAGRGFSNAVTHEPRGFQGYAKCPCKLICADALLAGRNKEDCLQPEPQRDVAGLENGPNLHSERLAALVALVGADPGTLALHRGNAIYAAAMGTNWTLRPNASLDPAVGSGFVVEMLVGKDGHGLNLLMKIL